MQSPEQIARAKIDRLLADAGWVVQSGDGFDRTAVLGVAVRKFPLPAGFCEYLLFVAGKAAGVIKAKNTGVTLSGVVDQDVVDGVRSNIRDLKLDVNDVGFEEDWPAQRQHKEREGVEFSNDDAD